MKPPPLPGAIQKDFQLVDQIIRERIASQPVVAEMLGKSVHAEQQMSLRAALALLAAHFGDYSIERVQHVASTGELIFIATQIHDSLIDQAARRRGTTQAHGAWTHGVPLMVGDFMYALSAGEMALVSDPRAIAYFAEAVKQFCEGVLTPVTLLRPLREAEQQYRFWVGCKAAICESAMMAGGAVSGCDETQIATLGQCGRELGMAYVIQREAESYRAPAATTNGVSNHVQRISGITLPLIYAAQHSEQIAALTDDPPSDPMHVAWLYNEVRAHGVAPTLALARRLRDQALAALDIFDNPLARQMIDDFAHQLIV